MDVHIEPTATPYDSPYRLFFHGTEESITIPDEGRYCLLTVLEPARTNKDQRLLST